MDNSSLFRGRFDMPVTVLLADGHQLVRQSLKVLMENGGFKVVGEAANGDEALQLARTLRPDVAVLEVAMPVLNGIDAARKIQRVSPKTKSVLLTMHTDSRYIMEGLRGGAKGYVMKTDAAEVLVRAIRGAARGETYLSPEIADMVVHAYQNKAEIPADPLTARERHVLQLIAEGKTTKEAATTLDVSPRTAETYRTRIMAKLHLHKTADLVRYAVRRGIIQA
jgi:DNA-binding NarL/FixJ family response regulator